MLQVGSTPDASTSSDYDVIARDLRQLADEAAAQHPPIRVYASPAPSFVSVERRLLAPSAYELWAWGAHV